MPFNVGDRVEYCGIRRELRGMLGIVRGRNGEGLYGVEFDEPFVRGHDLDGLTTRQFSGWWLSEDRVKTAAGRAVPGTRARCIGEFFKKQESLSCPST